MPSSLRTMAVALAAGAATIMAAPAASAAAPAATTAPLGGPGLTGTPITLASNVQLSGYDVAADGSGRAYVGWIADKGSGRRVYLCSLPRGATACAGGIQSIDSLGASSAQGLRVLATAAGKVTLVWFHDTIASENGPQGSEIAIATSQSGGPLSAPADVATAPSFGTLLDAVLSPGGSIWTVAQPSGASRLLQIRPGLATSPVTIMAPYFVGVARLRFTGTTAVVAIQKFGAITLPVSFASKAAGPWSAFRQVAHTWTSDAELGLASTTSGIRLIASVSNANYYPVVSRWTGSGFTAPALTGDRSNCSPSSHDLAADASGRLADVSVECGDLAIANLTDTAHAAIVRFGVHGIFAGGSPQLATTPRGRAWAAWSVESASTGDHLLVAPVLLPGRAVTATRASGGNRVTLRGPASCLPPVDLGVGVKGSAASGWRVTSAVLRLGGTTLHSTTLHGGALTAGARYTLTGRVTFARGGSRVTLTATLTFRSCPNP